MADQAHDVDDDLGPTDNLPGSSTGEPNAELKARAGVSTKPTDGALVELD